jgi:hypothetical protein
MGTGENTTTWGTVTNVNLGTAIEEAITGSVDVAFSSAHVTLTLTDTNSTQSARNLRLNLTGTATAGYNLVLGSGCQIEKAYIVNNGTDGIITVKNTTGTGIAVPAGKTTWVYNDGTNVVDAINTVTTLSVASTLGVTGAATFASTVNLPNSANVSTTGRYYSETATGGASLGLHNNLTSANGILSVESTANGVRAAEFMASSQVSPGQIAVLIRNDTQTSYALYFLYGASTNVGSVTFTSTATAYNTSSDGRMKIDRSTYDPGDLFDRINVHNFTWAHTGTPGLGIIAQELAEVCPGWVTPGDDGNGKPGDEGYRMWQTPITEPLAAIMAELKALRARVAALEAG